MTHQANIPALMELLYKQTCDGNYSVKQTVRRELGLNLIDLAKKMGIDEAEIMQALYETHEGPVFYYP